MIVPMKKISLVVLEKERKSVLKALRSLGVVHLEEVEGSGDTLAELNENKKKVETAWSILSEVKLSKDDVKALKKNPKTLEKTQALQLANRVLDLVEEKKAARDAINADTNEALRFEAWGDFNPEDLVMLKEKGINFALYEIATEKYSSIGEEVQTVLVNKDKSNARFLVYSENELPANERPEGLPPEAFMVTNPRCSVAELKANIEANNRKIENIEKEIASLAVNAAALKASFAEFDGDVEFENFFSGMACENETDESGNEIKTRLSWLTGYVPCEDMANVALKAKAENWAYVASDPTEEDNVPTKLKNNKFVELIYPVTDFLGTVPGYNEYDISNWFLLFFTVFFGMIFGDAGYGFLMVVIGFLGIMSAVTKKKSVAPAMNLLLLLGLATMAWGAITCTWFGLTPQQMEAFHLGFLPKLSIPALSNATSAIEGVKLSLKTADGKVVEITNAMWVKENLQIFCFTLALVQLSVAHLKGIVRYRKSLKLFGELGSMLMLWGMYYVVLSMVVDSVRFPLGVTPETVMVYGIPLPTVCIGLIGFGFFLNFVFANYAGNLGKSILESLKGIVSVLLGVVNIFSDIVSYIRLWAVALAGGAISATVNNMAGPMLGGFIIFMGVLLLVFGHGLNMILNVLSVIVHGVRLNTLEFSNHLGMTWAGYKYKPFKDVA